MTLHPLKITIKSVVDVVGALAADTMNGNMYMYDTNKLNGSTGHGTEQLRTVVRKGDQVIWNALPLECEAYVGIDGIEIDKEFCDIEKKTYPGTDISYWIGTIKKDTKITAYHIRFKLGTREAPVTTASPSYLVGTDT